MEAVLHCLRRNCFLTDDDDNDNDNDNHNGNDNDNYNHDNYNEEITSLRNSLSLHHRDNVNLVYEPPTALSRDYADDNGNNDDYDFGNDEDEVNSSNAQRSQRPQPRRRSMNMNRNQYQKLANANTNATDIFKKETFFQPIMDFFQNRNHSKNNDNTRTHNNNNYNDDNNDDSGDGDRNSTTNNSNSTNIYNKNNNDEDNLKFPTSPLIHGAKPSSIITSPSNHIPTLSSLLSTEIVIPGSDLQKQMSQSLRDQHQNHNYNATTDTADTTNTNTNTSLLQYEDECVICMESFDQNNPRMPTSCGCGLNKTYFHLPCLYHWIEQSSGRECPSCRKTLIWQEF
jgi:hypothetical protein